MSTLEKIQKDIANELLCCADFTDISIWCNNSYCTKHNSKNQIEIIVGFPMPITCAEKSNHAFFTNVEIPVEVSFLKSAILSPIKPTAILESICKRLHNKKFFSSEKIGKLLENTTISFFWRFFRQNFSINFFFNEFGKFSLSKSFVIEE